MADEQLNHLEDALNCSNEAAELITALAPAYNSKTDKIVLDIDRFENKLSELKNRNVSEAVVLESDLLGLRVQMISRSANLKELQGRAHASLLFMMNKMPSKLPLGCG